MKKSQYPSIGNSQSQLYTYKQQNKEKVKMLVAESCSTLCDPQGL